MILETYRKIFSHSLQSCNNLHVLSLCPHLHLRRKLVWTQQKVQLIAPCDCHSLYQFWEWQTLFKVKIQYHYYYTYSTTENKENCHPGCAVTPTVLNDCRRLPNPCPLPTSFSKRVQKSLERGTLSGNAKLMFLREAFTFYYGICPNPLPHEYETMCETLCNKYPELKDKLPVDEKKPWVSLKIHFLHHSLCVSGHNCDVGRHKLN